MYVLRFLCFGTLFTAGLVKGRCTLTLQSFKDNEPLFITANPGDLVRPRVANRKAVITIPNDPDKQLIACPGAGNWNIGTNRETATLTCRNGNIVLDNGDTNEAKFGCSKKYASSADKILNTKCGKIGGGGDNVALGFNVKSPSLWMPQIGVCHNIDVMYTHYSSHSLYGESIKGAVPGVRRPQFKKGNNILFKNANMDEIYKQTNQIYSFDQILGPGAGQHYITKDFLSKGHLAPDGDFVSASEQMMTYYYINVAPQWQGFNCGNWLTLEKTVRRLASEKFNVTLNVYTGTHGILKLEYQNSGLKEIYLKQQRKNGEPKVQIAVPNVFWKLIQHPITQDCVVVVGHNNVFLATPPTAICTPITPTGWPVYKGQITKGYFYYCDYNSFKTAVPNHPNAHCNGTLNA